MIESHNLENKIDEIYRHYYLDVYKFIICYSGNQNDSEDMTQEVFIRVLKNLSKYDYSSSLKTWIFSIAKHVAIDHYRKTRFTTILKEGFFKQLISNEKGPVEYAEQNETKIYINETISKIKPNYRMVLILRGINEFSIKETAQILNYSESKVKVVYHRAIKEFEKTMNSDLGEVISNES
ncbi:RNA polymerase sigma factor [Psychrobacillus sp. L3]|uniref:RNA polymerase sigma factor n=1 Tax=Psychrobacillus sp. L3 TaxID=3236891 RepID=UPI0036F43FEF